jgi:hypothetical protein
MNITQFSFDGKKLFGTMAAIQALRTKCIINHSLYNDDKHYRPFAIRISKYMYMKHGFYLLIPQDFNARRFGVTTMHIGNKKGTLVDDEQSANQNRIIFSLVQHQITSSDSFGYENLVWSRNFDCFNLQEKFRMNLVVYD